MYDVIVVGGGPAGLTAQLYAIQKGLKCLLISQDLGGKTNFRLALPWMSNPIQAGPGVLRGMEMVNYIRSELEWLSFDWKMAAVGTVQQTEQGFLVVTTGQGDGNERQEIASKAVVIATGTRQVPLNVPGEKEYFLRGVAYSALSYAPLFRDRVAAVIGESELAIRSATELATVAKQVYLICNHTEMLSIPQGTKLKTQPAARIMEGYQVSEIKGEGEPGEGFARELVVRRPDGQVEALEIDGIFIERGLLPNSAMVAGLVQTDPAGRICVDATTCTNVAGIFAAGDVTNLYAENLLVAMGEGAKAALSTYDYLLPTM